MKGKETNLEQRYRHLETETGLVRDLPELENDIIEAIVSEFNASLDPDIERRVIHDINEYGDGDFEKLFIIKSWAIMRLFEECVLEYCYNKPSRNKWAKEREQRFERICRRARNMLDPVFDKWGSYSNPGSEA